MTYTELKRKLTELIEAHKATSSIIKTDEAALRGILLEVRRAMGEVKLLNDKKDSLQETLREIANKIDKQSKPDFDRIYDSNSLNIEKKFAQLAPKAEEIYNGINKGNLILKELAKLEEEFSEKEINKKNTDLSPLWKEVKSIYGVDDFKDEIEMEISDSVMSIAPQEEPDEKIGDLLEELKKEINNSSNPEEKKKKGWFRKGA